MWAPGYDPRVRPRSPVRRAASLRPGRVRIGAWALCLAVLALPFAPRAALVHAHDGHGTHTHTVGVLAAPAAWVHGHAHAHDHDHRHAHPSGSDRPDGRSSDAPEPVDECAPEVEDWLDLSSELCSARVPGGAHAEFRLRLVAAALPPPRDARPWRPPNASPRDLPDPACTASVRARCLATTVLLI